MLGEEYDDGNESPLNETTSGSIDSSVRLMKINEYRNEVDLPPLPSKRELLRQQNKNLNDKGPVFEGMNEVEMNDYGSAKEDEEEGRIIFSDDESADSYGNMVVFNETPRKKASPTQATMMAEERDDAPEAAESEQECDTVEEDDDESEAERMGIKKDMQQRVEEPVQVRRSCRLRSKFVSKFQNLKNADKGKGKGKGKKDDAVDD